MAEATITEYERLAKDADGNTIMVGEEPALASQKVTYTSSTQSSALNVRTRFVRIAAEGAAAHFKVGIDPTATDADPYIGAGAAEYFGVNPSLARDGTLEVALYDGSS